MIKDRNGNILSTDAQQDKTLSFLYRNAFGRCITKILVRRWVSDLVGFYMSSPLSKGRIKRLIKHHAIDMSEYEDRKFSSFNDFFTREVREGKRPFSDNADELLSPCDAKLTVHDITEHGVYRIKGCDYGVAELLGSTEKASEFFGGKCLIYRLTVDNYHRYRYFDSGKELEYEFIPGVLHTVNPIAVARLDVYGRNCREVTYLETDNFGKCAYVEVGAMMVGRINNRHPEEGFSRGDEKGYFSFGGSTIVLLFKRDRVSIDSDIIENSAEGIETTVKCGEKVGAK